MSLLLVLRPRPLRWRQLQGSAGPALAGDVLCAQRHERLNALGIQRGERLSGWGWGMGRQTIEKHGKQHEISTMTEIQAAVKWAIKSFLVNMQANYVEKVPQGVKL